MPTEFQNAQKMTVGDILRIFAIGMSSVITLIIIATQQAAQRYNI